MPNNGDQALLDREVTGLRDSVRQPGHRHIQNSTEWARQQFAANPAVRGEYRQAEAKHWPLFQNHEATIANNVENAVRHFARDGLTRSDYLKALATEPRLLRQKPAQIISNIETGTDHNWAWRFDRVV